MSKREKSVAEVGIVDLMNRVSDGFGDELRFINSEMGGVLVIPGNDRAGVSEMVLDITVMPDATKDAYDEQGRAEPSQFSNLLLSLELRAVGATDGEEISVKIPVDWSKALEEEDEQKLRSFLSIVKAYDQR